MKYSDYAEELSQQLIKMVEREQAPWQKGYDLKGFEPESYATGKPYNGFNAMRLMLTSVERGYEDNRWITANQARKEGGRPVGVGVPIIFATDERIIKEKDKETGEETQKRVKLSKPVFKHSIVYNVSQVDGLDPIERKTPEDLGWEQADLLKNIQEKTKADVVHSGAPMYVPSLDKIQMPPPEAYEDERRYASSLIHETSHWTGNEKRLDRDFGPQGSTAYAREELVAEISTMLIGARAGIDTFVENNESYIAHWWEHAKELLEEKPTEIMKICKDAYATREYILEGKELDRLEQEGVEHKVELTDREKQNGRIELDIQYSEKNAAKKLAKNIGVDLKWDRQGKTWFANVEEGQNIGDLAKFRVNENVNNLDSTIEGLKLDLERHYGTAAKAGYTDDMTYPVTHDYANSIVEQGKGSISYENAVDALIVNLPMKDDYKQGMMAYAEDHGEMGHLQETKRHNLDVTIQSKEEAKELTEAHGTKLRWDRKEKTWYANTTEDTAAKLQTKFDELGYSKASEGMSESLTPSSDNKTGQPALTRDSIKDEIDKNGLSSTNDILEFRAIVNAYASFNQEDRDEVMDYALSGMKKEIAAPIADFIKKYDTQEQDLVAKKEEPKQPATGKQIDTAYERLSNVLNEGRMMGYSEQADYYDASLLSKRATELMELLENPAQNVDPELLQLSESLVDQATDFKIYHNELTSDHSHLSKQDVLNEYVDNEADNHHAENYVLLAKHYGTPQELGEAMRNVQERDNKGSLNSDLNSKVHNSVNGYYSELVTDAKRESYSRAIDHNTEMRGNFEKIHKSYMEKGKDTSDLVEIAGDIATNLHTITKDLDPPLYSKTEAVEVVLHNIEGKEEFTPKVMSYLAEKETNSNDESKKFFDVAKAKREEAKALAKEEGLTLRWDKDIKQWHTHTTTKKAAEVQQKLDEQGFSNKSIALQQDQPSSDGAKRYDYDIPYTKKDAAKDLAQEHGVKLRFDRQLKTWHATMTEDQEDAFSKDLKEKVLNIKTYTIQKDQPAAQPAQANKDAIDKEQAQRVYLNVPYDEKDAVKTLAKKDGISMQFDGEVKAWFVNKDELTPRLKSYVPDMAKEAPMEAGNFGDEMAKLGAANPNITPELDGKWHRVKAGDDSQGKASISYKGYNNGVPNALIINHKTGERSKWIGKTAELSKEDKQVLRIVNKNNQEAAKAEMVATRNKAAAVAKEAVNSANKADASHPYLQAKGIQPHGLKQDDKGYLIAPLTNANGEIRSMQRINQKGQKGYQKGGEKSGNFHSFGKLTNGKPIIIAEGIATAATVHEVMGSATAAALDSGNLTPVTKALAKKYPDSPIVIAADNDHNLKVNGEPKNVGVLKAKEAAASVDRDVVVVYPQVDKNDPLSDKITDYNDVAKEKGRQEVADSLKKLMDKENVKRQLRELKGKEGKEETAKTARKQVKKGREDDGR